ncbi:hypothetical protein G9A89_010091 [Geosiphon pyriformis]|nr:hypothetical protein G9A89_010091 [Geosiphon pyriformis]
MLRNSIKPLNVKFLKILPPIFSNTFNFEKKNLLKELSANFPTADGIHLPPINNNLLFYSALLHPSRGNELDKKLSSLLPAKFHRLAFLGAAALSYQVAFILQEKYSEATVGNLTALRSEIISRSNLAQFCKSVGLKDKIVVSSKIQDQVNVQGEAFEAYIGALCLDYKKYFDSNSKANVKLIAQRVTEFAVEGHVPNF